MQREGAPDDVIRRAIVTLDSQGLIYEGREPLDDDKRESALGPEEMRRFGFEGGRAHGLEEVIARVQPTILVGTAGTPGRVHRGRDPRDGRNTPDADRLPALQPDRRAPRPSPPT